MSRSDEGTDDAEALDRQVAKQAARHRHHPTIRFLGWVGEVADQPQLASLCGLTALVGASQGNRRLAATGLLMLTAHGVATLAKSIIKRKVNRTRPRVSIEEGRYEMRPGRSQDGDDQSFPSGHAAGAVAVAGIRAARALLRMEQRELATLSGVSLPSIKRLESKPGMLAAQAKTVSMIETVFQLRGIEFAEDEKSVTVRLVKGADVL